MPGSPLTITSLSPSPEQNLTVLSRACELEPKALMPVILLANLLFSQRKYAEACTHFEKAVTNSGHVKARARATFFSLKSPTQKERLVYLQICDEPYRGYIVACSRIVACQRLLAQTPQRSKIETAEVRLHGEDPASQRLTKLYLQAIHLSKAEKYPAALYDLEKILTIFTLTPEDEAEIIFRMAWAYERQGNIPFARLTYGQAITLGHPDAGGCLEVLENRTPSPS